MILISINNYQSTIIMLYHNRINTKTGSTNDEQIIYSFRTSNLIERFHD